MAKKSEGIQQKEEESTEGGLSLFICSFSFEAGSLSRPSSPRTLHSKPVLNSKILHPLTQTLGLKALYTIPADFFIIIILK